MSKLRGGRCSLRSYRTADAAALAALADDVAVARWMTARFPHPYTLEDARIWIAHTLGESPIDSFAIDVDGELAGGAGITPHTDERRGSAEFGYWLGRAFWGRGIATEAARLLAAHAFADRALRRLEAHVFVANHASARVLEKCGFSREAVLREAYVERDGTVRDGLLYARLRSDPARPLE
jgi:RimJ/RimL family protein N-acetyltransferase